MQVVACQTIVGNRAGGGGEPISCMAVVCPKWRGAGGEGGLVPISCMTAVCQTIVRNIAREG